MSPHESSPRRERELRIWVLENEQGKVNDQMLEEDEALRIVIFANEEEQRFWRETGSRSQEHEERPHTHEKTGDSDENKGGSEYSNSYYTNSLESGSEGSLTDNPPKKRSGGSDASLTDNPPKKPEQSDGNVSHRGGWGGRDRTRHSSTNSTSSESSNQPLEHQRMSPIFCGGVRSRSRKYPRTTHVPRELRLARDAFCPMMIVNVCKFDELSPREQLHIVTTAIDLGYPWHFSFEVPEDEWPFMFQGRSNPISERFMTDFSDYGNGEELKMANEREAERVSGGVSGAEFHVKKKEKKVRSRRRRGRNEKRRRFEGGVA